MLRAVPCVVLLAIVGSPTMAQTWTQLFPVPWPGARGEHAMVYDSARDRMVVLGGWQDYYCCSCFRARSHDCGWEDSWEFDGSTWAGPDFFNSGWLARHGMAYDEARGVTVAYGGHLWVEYATNGVWEMSGAGSWSQVGDGPTGRTDPAMTYDSDRRLVLMGGGLDRNQIPFAEIWEYDGTAWSPGPTPPGMIGGLAYDRNRRRSVASLWTGGTWELDGATWIQTTTVVAPGSMDYDASRRLVVSCCTSEYDGVEWRSRGTAPATILSGTRIAYDSLRERIVLFGGGEFWGPATDETWSYGCSLKVSPAALPDATTGSPYAQTLAGSGGTPPYVFAVASGSLPAGVSLAPSGLLSGTPTAPGTARFRVRIEDAVGGFCEVAYGLTVLPPICPPVADFSGNPRSGAAPLTVAFTDGSSSATTYAWSFGDGGTSAAQNPVHAYAVPGDYTVTLTVGSPCGQDTEVKVDYIRVTAPPPNDEMITGAGASASNAPLVRTWGRGSPPPEGAAWTAYGASQFGVNVGAADIVGGGATEVLTGPGPGPAYGPQVRAFQPTGAAIAKVDFYAYGTLRQGVTVGGGDVDRDGHGEILTGAGPSTVFGPHVRGFDFDGTALAPIAKLSFFAYGTLQYGVRAAGGDVDGDGFAEVVTGAGAGPSFGAHVRGYDYDGAALQPLPINFFAFSAGRYGACVASGSTDADPEAEIVVSRGPDPNQDGRIRGYDVTATGVLPAFNVAAFVSLGGAEVAAGSMDGDAVDEVVVGTGWGAPTPSTVRLFAISGTGGTQLTSFAPYPGQVYGSKVAAGDTGVP